MSKGVGEDRGGERGKNELFKLAFSSRKKKRKGGGEVFDHLKKEMREREGAP